jgi:hypothetical protein
MSNKTFFLADSKDANSLAIFSPYEKGSVSIWKYIKSGALGMLPKLGFRCIKKMTTYAL